MYGRTEIRKWLKTHRCTDERRYGKDDHIDEIRTVTSSLDLHNHRERSTVTWSVTEGTYNEIITHSKRKSTNKVQNSNTPKLDGVYILSDAYTTTPCIHFVGINRKYLTTYTCTQYITLYIYFYAITLFIGNIHIILRLLTLHTSNSALITLKLVSQLKYANTHYSNNVEIEVWLS